MKVLISGYYGFGNAGDELILHAIIAELKARRPDTQFTVLSAQPRQTALQQGVSAVNRWDPFQVFWAVRQCDAFVSGGGGLFQDATGSKSLYYYLMLIKLAKFFGKKVFVYAVGVNELKRFNRFATTRILRLADHITVRETYSKELLEQWGCPAEKIEVTVDPVFQRETTANTIHEHHPKIAFVLRPPRKGQWPVEVFAKLADSLSQRLSARVIFIPFHGAYDIPFTLAVMNSMRTTARLVNWNRADDLFTVFSDVDLVISQRLHGLILATLHGIPLIGISEDPKLQRFLREIKQKHIVSLDQTNPYSLLAMITDVWEWREEFRSSASQLLPSLRARSKSTADLFFRTIDHSTAHAPSR